MDELNEAFEKVKFPLTSIPMVLYSSYRVVKEEKSFEKFVEVVNDFLNGYDNNEEYKKYVQSATSDSENVRGRFDYWVELIKSV